ncbi:hypothetical protein GW17_00055912 [Ensete ventricosum]|nr:hypothetical protein GW17_00055912 [Ensete ventricosum]
MPVSCSTLNTVPLKRRPENSKTPRRGREADLSSACEFSIEMTDATVKFGLLVSMFQAMLRDRTAAKKRKRFRTFLDRVYTGREFFSAVRLILPGLDRERGTYGLKESALATCVVDALGLAKDSPDALRLVNWRKGGARSGANAGNFALIAAEVSFSLQTLFCAVLRIRPPEILNHFVAFVPMSLGNTV